MFLMLDGIYNVDVIFGRWGLDNPTTHNFPHVLQDVLIYVFFYHYYLLVYVLRHTVYNFSIFLMFWYVIILSGGFLKYQSGKP